MYSAGAQPADTASTSRAADEIGEVVQVVGAGKTVGDSVAVLLTMGNGVVELSAIPSVLWAPGAPA
jgi:hypothetical protein